MLVAHLPAGYILTKKIQACGNCDKYLWLGLVASVLPDAGIIYLFFNDIVNFRDLHHYFWPHYPVYWLIIGLILYGLTYLKKNRNDRFVITIFLSGIFLHLFLDTITGEIRWLYPFSAEEFSFFYRLSSIPGLSFKYSFWKIRIYWTILLEIGIIVWAFIIFYKK